MPQDAIFLEGFTQPRDFNFARKLMAWFLAPPPSSLPDEWAESENGVRFDYSKEMTGPCTFTGRNYLRRPIRDAVDPAVRKQTKVFGRGNGKTLCDEVQMCYKLKFLPGVRGLGVYPATKGEGGSENFVSTRLAKTIKASPGLRDILPPKGQERFYLNKKIVRLNGSHYGFIGSNSGSQGVSNRLTDIYFDEMEKFDDKLKHEAGIDKLAEGSVEGVAEYQIHYSSTPTIEDGLIWRAIQKSNLHLYLVPCPHCNPGDATRGHGATEADREIEARAKNFQGWFIILFSEQYSAGWPTKFQSADPALNGRSIPFAHVQFRYAPPGVEQASSLLSRASGPETSPERKETNHNENDARNRDGTWNLERAQANAHLVCPHCRGCIRDWETVGTRGDVSGAEAGNHRQDAGATHGRIIADDKIWMDKNGVWICVKPGEPGHVGYMINSLYAPVLNKESTWGGRSVAFLTAIEEGSKATQTFINAILAGVYTNQERARVEIETAGDPHRVSSVLKLPIMSCDHQHLYPKFWIAVGEWTASVLRPPRTPEQLAELVKTFSADERAVYVKIAGALPAAKNEETLYTPDWIMGQVSRTDHWPRLADWLAGNGITGKNLTEWYQAEFQGDLTRMLEFICRQDSVKVPLGRQGDCVLKEIGSADSWEELDDFQRRHGVKNLDVIIDARWGEMGQAEVYAECYRRCPPQALCYVNPLLKNAIGRPKFTSTPGPGCKRYASLPWTPVLGAPAHKVWPGPDKIRLPYGMVLHDAFVGTADAQQYYLDAFEFSAQWALTEMARVRKKYEFKLAPDVKFSGNNSKMHPVTAQEFALHLRGYYFEEKKQVWIAPGKAGGSQARANPNHLYDCCKNMVAYATYKGIFRYERGQTNSKIN